MDSLSEKVYTSTMPSLHRLAVFALMTALAPGVAPAQLSKFADPNWNPNMETNKVCDLAGKTFGAGTAAAKMGNRTAKLGDGGLKLKEFPVKPWSTPEATGFKERRANLPSEAPMGPRSSPYAGKAFNPGRTGDLSNFQKSYATEANKWSGKEAPGLDSNRAAKDFQGKTSKELQATVDRTFHRTLTVDEVKTLLNEPAASPQPTAEVKNKDESLFRQGVGRDTRGLPQPGAAVGVKGKSGHARPGR